MLIDPLNIFQDIKREILLNHRNVEVYAFGSRVSGVSTAKKWDFDVIVVYKDEPILSNELMLYLRTKFDGRIDENERLVKVDVWTIHKDKFEEFSNETKNIVHAFLL